jgi:hypothetical protein
MEFVHASDLCAYVKSVFHIHPLNKTIVCIRLAIQLTAVAGRSTQGGVAFDGSCMTFDLG